ncbi:MAG: hypothetical protein U0324_41970 [Polyangiales bacterium]
MESYAAPVRELAESLKWFVRAREVRCLHATVETDLRKAALTLVAAQEMHPDNRAPFFVLEEPFARADEGWAARVERLRAHHETRRAAFAKENVALAPLPPPDPAAGPAGFAAQLAQLLATKVEWNEGLVVALAPTQVDDPARWSALVEQLVKAPALAEVRWVAVDLESPTLGAWVDDLGERGMRVRCAVDAAAAQREFGRMLDAMEAAPEGVSGPARTGAAWPRGVVPPSRPEYPVATPAELEATLAAAGVAVPASAKVAPALGLKVLRASQAMRQRRDDEAVRLQREARDLCLAHGMVRDGVVMEMILASYLVPMEKRREAVELYRQAAARAEGHGFGDLSAQAHVAVGALHLLDRRREEAYQAYYTAAVRAEEADQKPLAIEAWRLAGETRAEAGDEAGASACWSRALEVADVASPPEAKASSAGEVAARLAAVCRARGLEAQARALDARAEALLAERAPAEGDA